MCHVTITSQMAPCSEHVFVPLSQINAGQIKEAEDLLDRVLASSPKELGALVARGTARALRRELQGGCWGRVPQVHVWVLCVCVCARAHDLMPRLSGCEATRYVVTTLGASLQALLMTSVPPLWWSRGMLTRGSAVARPAAPWATMRAHSLICRRPSISCLCGGRWVEGMSSHIMSP